MKISLVLTSFEREEKMKRLFDSLKINSFRELEIVFIDQNSNEVNEKLLSKYEELNINIIKLGKRTSLSAARNIGLKYCSGEIIGFPDDDCWYQENFFENLVDEFNRKKIDFINCAVYDPISKSNYGNKFSKKKYTLINNKNCYKFATSVGIFFKVKTCKLNNFDENLGVGAKWHGGEDLDYVLHLVKTFKKGLFLNELKVYHECEKEVDLEKIYKYNIGFGAVLKKNFKNYREYYSLILYIKNVLILEIKLLISKGNQKVKLSRILKGLKKGYNDYE